MPKKQILELRWAEFSRAGLEALDLYWALTGRMGRNPWLSPDSPAACWAWPGPAREERVYMGVD